MQVTSPVRTPRAIARDIAAAKQHIETLYVELGPALRLARKRRQLTQDDVALRVNVHRTLIAAIETGRRRPSADLEQDLIALLGG